MKVLNGFSYQELNQQASEFSLSLIQFLDRYPQLRSAIQGYPIDHMAVKAHGNSDYKQYVRAVLPFSILPVTYTPMDNRTITTAFLKEEINFLNFGHTDVLEIIEPKPEKADKSDARFDHIEIRNPNFPQLEHLLQTLGIPYTPYKNPKHQALVIIINEQLQEIKFTNGNLREIVQMEIFEGNAVSWPS